MADATGSSSTGVGGVHDPETDLDEIDDYGYGDDDDLDPELLEPPTQAWRARTAIEMVISGAIGLLASFVLSIDALKLAADPGRRPQLQPQRGHQLRQGGRVVGGAAVRLSPTRSSASRRSRSSSPSRWQCSAA